MFQTAQEAQSVVILASGVSPCVSTASRYVNKLWLELQGNWRQSGGTGSRSPTDS